MFLKKVKINKSILQKIFCVILGGVLLLPSSIYGGSGFPIGVDMPIQLSKLVFEASKPVIETPKN